MKKPPSLLFSLFWGTISGAGFFPKAPGTFASFLTVALLYFWQPGYFLTLLALILLFVMGIITTPIIEKKYGSDPGIIVIDEVVGQGLIFLFIATPGFWEYVLGFALFRIFDIIKPLGVDKLQKLPSGWGVMLDDVLAGVYATITLLLLTYWNVL